MKWRIFKLSPYNLFLKIRIWFICTFLPNKLNNNRTSDEKEGHEISFFDDFEVDYVKVWRKL